MVVAILISKQKFPNLQGEQGRCQHHDTEAGNRERRALAIKHLMNPLLPPAL